MYFTQLPDHKKPGFDERLHFVKFKKYNIIFNASGADSYCDKHVGCLSFKTVLNGEEWYGVGNRQLAVRPRQFLVLNDDQPYSCRINYGESVRTISIFFKKEFASAVFRDALYREEELLDDPCDTNEKAPGFFQTLHPIEPGLQRQLRNLIDSLDKYAYNSCMVDEQLVFLLRRLIGVQQAELCNAEKVCAVKSTTKSEIYRRLCMARDILHSSYMDNPDLDTIGKMSCLSVPQLVRQFKAAFHTTPHQYLNRVKLEHAAELLRSTENPVQQITWMCGFEDVSAFSRAFKGSYGVQPSRFRSEKR
jgi:AraC-like DNA-binding protein